MVHSTMHDVVHRRLSANTSCQSLSARNAKRWRGSASTVRRKSCVVNATGPPCVRTTSVKRYFLDYFFHDYVCFSCSAMQSVTEEPNGTEATARAKFQLRICTPGHVQECRQCDGSALCCHNKIRRECKECGGSSYCDHGKRKRR